MARSAPSKPLRSRTVVTPASSVFFAFACARNTRTATWRGGWRSGLVPDAGSQKNVMWVWESISPGKPV